MLKVKRPAIFGWNKSETVTNRWVGQGLTKLDLLEDERSKARPTSLARLAKDRDIEYL